MNRASINYQEQLAAAIQLAIRKPVQSVTALAALLYDQWYAPSVVEPVLYTSPAELIAHLRAADAAGRRFEAGWVVADPQVIAQQIGSPGSPWQVPVTRAGEPRWVDPIDFIYPGGIGLRPPPGVSIEISQRRDSPYLLPGWWTTLSSTYSERIRPVIRIYWSILPAALCTLVEALTASLDPMLPYAIKCPVDQARFHRPDAVTLYLPASMWHIVRDILQAVKAYCHDIFRDSIPAFTLPLSKGIALAEDPETDSYGMSRCTTLAESMWPVLGSGDPQAIALAVTNTFRQCGLRLDAPYLNPGSKAQYLL